MLDEDPNQEPISDILHHRHVPHGRSRNRGKKGSGSKTFDPLRAIGVYDVVVGTKKPGWKSTGNEASLVSHFTIHGLSSDETGLIASFGISARGTVDGLGILSGSKRNTKRIVSELEAEGLPEQETTGQNSGGGEHEDFTTASKDDDQSGDDDADDGQQDHKSALELEDDKINRRAQAFEKNSFRNPKFWMCWKGRVTVKNSPLLGGNQEQISNEAAVVESNMGYVVFTGNDCTTFDGTLTSETLGWDNIKIKGHKVKSHAGPCPMGWLDFDRS